MLFGFFIIVLTSVPTREEVSFSRWSSFSVTGC